MQAQGGVDEYTSENMEQMSFGSDAEVIDNQDNNEDFYD